mmetsp:Transcript_17765/g.26294  ORF Transcript_17765/g.26294 Transcript_17765/m.26294 type:complete len:327 (-) Transcript_17765:101-1081(-)
MCLINSSAAMAVPTIMPQTQEPTVTPSTSPIISKQMVEMPMLVEDFPVQQQSSTPPIVPNSPMTVNGSCQQHLNSIQTKNNDLNKARVVHHDYHDHSREREEGTANPVARGGVTTPFPIHLHDMLERIEREGYGHVVSWQSHGRCFVIHNQKEFIEHVMSTYTKHSKFPSFRRQLNLYGYRRITKGPDKGGYYHELFLRGKPFLARRMQRKCIKGTGVRCRNNPQEEPNFYKMAPIAIIPSDSDSEDEQNKVQSKPQVVTQVAPKAIAPSPPPPTPIPSPDVIVNFEGQSFHLMDEHEKIWQKMESLIRSTDQTIPIVENDFQFEL